MFKGRLAILTGIALLATAVQVRADATTFNLNLTGNATTGLTFTGTTNNIIEVDVSNGVSYNNSFSAGAAAPGDRIQTVGVATFNLGLGQPLQAPAPGTGVSPIPNHNIVGVFALTGTQQATPVGTLADQFRTGQLRLYDLGTNGISLANPATWVPNIAILSQGLLQTYNLTFQVGPGAGVHQAVVAGPAATGQNVNQPGGSLQDVGIANIGSPFNASGNVLFTNATPGAGTFTVTNPAGFVDGLFVHVDQTSVSTAPFDLGLGAAGVANLNLLSLGFGQGLFADATLPGGTFNPQGPPFTNGDIAQLTSGKTYPVIIPLTTPTAPTIPEPASLIVWGLLAAGGSCYGSVRRWRMKRAKA